MRELPYRVRVGAIGDRESTLRDLTEGELRRQAESLRRQAREGASLDELLVPTFALVRETARRALGLRPYDVQMAAGISLHRGRVIEMQTGEGKTLAAVAPVVLHGWRGRGIHVLTVNDYLARRDAAWMGPVYERLGLSVGVVQEGMSAAERRAAYRCDVTYLTAREAGFDYLRDGLALEPGEQVQRALRWALVDEADSILVDEARIPLVIAGALDRDRIDLSRLAALARELTPGLDFETDEREQHTFLTEAGSERVEERLACGDLFRSEQVNLLAALRNALHAEALLHRDVHYIVRGGRVELVDERTGRVAEKRHWPDGLQAAVEAKEGLRLGEDGRILGSITMQHFLGLYPRLAGMTATATQATEELREVYGLEVELLPPHRPCIRHDRPDLVFSHREAKDRALVAEIRRVHGSGRPILVGTVSVLESERLAATLRADGIPARVLNAKNDAEEAEIVAEAGALGAVTISTNMAGRGTDIRLGGHDEQGRERVVSRGGLYVIGTHRHRSLRIDRQLRGRAGRQGDPGSSVFFVSLEDELLRRYGIQELVPERLFPEHSETAINSRVLRREIDRVQRIAEGESLSVRRRLWSFSQVLEQQRVFLRDWRQETLESRGPGTLAERNEALWQRRLAEIGEERLRQVERELGLRILDDCWGEYLTDLQSLRDEIHLVSLDGREPLAEFQLAAVRSFERLLTRIDERTVKTFARLEIGPEGVDWEAEGFRRPASTWSYLVSDTLFDVNLMRELAHRPAVGAWGVLVLGPVLFAWGLYLHLKRWRQSREDRR